MSSINNCDIYCFSLISIVVGTFIFGPGVAISCASSTGGNILLGTGGAFIAAGMIGMGIPKIRAIILKKDDETLQGTAASKVDDYFNNENLF